MLYLKLSGCLSALVLAVEAAFVPAAAEEPARLEFATPEQAVTPERSLAMLEVEPGLSVELAASEPQVIDPVAMAFDDAGRMWVVEMGDYPNPPDPANPRGRVRVLSDADGDGFYETAETFIDGLLFATGVMPYRGGAVVTVGGKLVWYRDDDGDRRADGSEDWLAGFAEQNPQLRVNDPSLGPDLRLYVANGLRSKSVREVDGEAVDLSNRDARLDLRDGTLEAVTGPSQFGMAWDRYGRRYFCTNRNPCDIVLCEQADAALSPLAGLAAMTAPVVPPGDASQVRPLTEAWTTSNLHSGQFTAACGLLITDSRHFASAPTPPLFPFIYRETPIHALTCEPTGNLVHRAPLSDEGGRVRALAAADQEFLASRDPWFRPVNLTEGPDGSIFVVDMYRAVIEHPEWVPDELKHRPDERLGDDRGRIYRISSPDARHRSLSVGLHRRPLSTRPTEELIELLKDDAEWMRATAARLLMERELDRNDTGRLRDMAVGTADARSIRMLALLRHHRYDLDGVIDNLLSSESVENSAFPVPRAANFQRRHRDEREPRGRAALWRQVQLLNLMSPRIFEHATEAIERGEREETIHACYCLAAEFDEAGEVSDALVASLGRRAAAAADDPHLLMAISAAGRARSGKVFAAFYRSLDQRLTKEARGAEPLWEAVTRWAELSADRRAWDDAIAVWRAGWNEAAPDPAGERRMRLHLAAVAGWVKSGGAGSLAAEEDFVAWLIDAAVSGAKGRSLQLQSIDLLGWLPAHVSLDPLREVASGHYDPAARAAAIDSLARLNDPELGDFIIKTFAAEGPLVRGRLFEAMRRSAQRQTRFVAALESGELSLRMFDAAQLEALRRLNAPGLADRVAKLLAGAVDADRQAVIERYSAVLEDAGDIDNGREVFRKQCASCHRVEGFGTAVGPDISDTRTQTPSQLLTSILDPNRAVDNNYFRMTVLTTDGEVVDGIVVGETDRTVTLRNASASVVVPRDEIEAMRPSGSSLMPEGVENQIGPDEMRDLIHYLKNWRY